MSVGCIKIYPWQLTNINFQKDFGLVVVLMEKSN